MTIGADGTETSDLIDRLLVEFTEVHRPRPEHSPCFRPILGWKAVLLPEKVMEGSVTEHMPCRFGICKIADFNVDGGRLGLGWG